MRGFCLKDQLLMEAITQRRSIRKYRNERFPMEELIALVEAARWAPSAGNSQPWEFLLVNDEDMVSGLKAVSPGWLKPAPALIVMCINKNRETDWSYIDVGAAMQNILLYAHSRGGRMLSNRKFRGRNGEGTPRYAAASRTGSFYDCGLF